MKRLAAAALTLLTAACGLDTASSFRDGVPQASQVTMKIPESKGAALTGVGTRQDLLEGEKAASYTLTRGVTVVVNGGAVAVLALVRTIADSTPTRVTGDVAVWGPFTDALSPNTYRFTITKNKTDDYSYVLEGRGKTEADSAMRVVLSGSHVVTGKELGKGTFLLDWNVAATLPEHDDNLGTAAYTYSHTAATAPVSIDAVFTQVLDRESGKKIDANYKYTANPGTGGNFEFKIIKDVVAGAALETAVVNSRWLETGAGRADLKVHGGDLPSEATSNECWDSGFLSTYLTTSYAPNAGWGQVGSCAFATAEYASGAIAP